jgi:hypothetical protein
LGFDDDNDSDESKLIVGGGVEWRYSTCRDDYEFGSS